MCDSEAAKRDDLVSIWCFWDWSLTDSPGLPLPPPTSLVLRCKTISSSTGRAQTIGKAFQLQNASCSAQNFGKTPCGESSRLPFSKWHCSGTALGTEHACLATYSLSLACDLSTRGAQLHFFVFCLRPDLQGQGQCCGGCKGSCASTCAETVVVTSFVLVSLR